MRGRTSDWSEGPSAMRPLWPRQPHALFLHVAIMGCVCVCVWRLRRREWVRLSMFAEGERRWKVAEGAGGSRSRAFRFRALKWTKSFERSLKGFRSIVALVVFVFCYGCVNFVTFSYWDVCAIACFMKYVKKSCEIWRHLLVIVFGWCC